MTTPVLNNGVFTRETKLKVGPHVDSYHLKNMMPGTKATDLGPMALWAMSQKVQMPLYQMSSFNSKNTIQVDNPDGKYTWQHPTVQDLPYIVEDMEPGVDYLGQDGETFRIKLNRRAFGNGAIFSYDKMNGIEMHVTEDQIIQDGSNYIYTVKIINKGNRAYVEKQYLTAGTQIISKGSGKGLDYGQVYDDIGEQERVHREYHNYVGGSEAHKYFSVSSRADLILRKGMNQDGSVNITEIWKSKDKKLDPSITNMDDMVRTMGKDYIAKSRAAGKLTKTFVTSLEDESFSRIGEDIENYLMWGQGGRIRQDNNPEDIRFSVGLWRQLDNSFKKTYDLADFSLDMFENELFNFFNGRVTFDGPDSKRKIIVQTGLGGMKLAIKKIREIALSQGLVTNSSDIGAITGKSMDLNYGFSFTSYDIPFLANVKFVINPAFDNVNNNDIENPMINGYCLSSYSFIVNDVTDGPDDNICLLKYGPDHAMKWFYQNGTMDYLGRTQGFQSSGMFTGYRVMMSQTMPAIMVKDPTRILKIVMRNPLTGYSL